MHARPVVCSGVANSVDEAVAGHAKNIDVTLFADGSLQVTDDGRGMPVDVHPEEKITGVELILTRLHAGGKFSNKNYQFSGGLHGVGVSVVNALSKNLEAWIRRDGREDHMSFVDGERRGKLDVVGKVAKTSTGTTLRFWPNPKYFDSPQFSLPRLRHVLRAKAVLCPGLTVTIDVETPKESERWVYTGGGRAVSKGVARRGRLRSGAAARRQVRGQARGRRVGRAVAARRRRGARRELRQPDRRRRAARTSTAYAPGSPTRCASSASSAISCRAASSSEDVWEGVNFVLSVKIEEPQFSGQTKERLSSRECATLVGGLIKDHFALWLNQHPETGDAIAQFAIENAEHRLKAAKTVVRKRIVAGPALPGKLADCTIQEPAKQARNRETQAVMPLRGKILNTWEVDVAELRASQEVPGEPQCIP